MTLYAQILNSAGPAFGVVLRHIRDRPDSPCLFHCTAGKDRTGVLAAILLKARPRLCCNKCSRLTVVVPYACTARGRR